MRQTKTMTDPAHDQILRLDPGNRSVLRETEPGSVEVRYRGLRRLSARDLIRVANSAWYIRFNEEQQMTLTLTNGAAEPKQETIEMDSAESKNHRGTLDVRVARSSILTGKFASEWLGDSKHLDIVIEPRIFHLLELKAPLLSLRTHRPELFSRQDSTRRFRKPVRTGRKEALKSVQGGRRR